MQTIECLSEQRAFLSMITRLRSFSQALTDGVTGAKKNSRVAIFTTRKAATTLKTSKFVTLVEFFFFQKKARATTKARLFRKVLAHRVARRACRFSQQSFSPSLLESVKRNPGRVREKKRKKGRSKKPPSARCRELRRRL